MSAIMTIVLIPKKVEEPFKSAHNERITDEDLLWAWLNGAS